MRTPRRSSAAAEPPTRPVIRVTVWPRAARREAVSVRTRSAPPGNSGRANVAIVRMFKRGLDLKSASSPSKTPSIRHRSAEERGRAGERLLVERIGGMLGEQVLEQALGRRLLARRARRQGAASGAATRRRTTGSSPLRSASSVPAPPDSSRRTRRTPGPSVTTSRWTATGNSSPAASPESTRPARPRASSSRAASTRSRIHPARSAPAATPEASLATETRATRAGPAVTAGSSNSDATASRQSARRATRSRPATSGPRARGGTGRAASPPDRHRPAVDQQAVGDVEQAGEQLVVPVGHADDPDEDGQVGHEQGHDRAAARRPALAPTASVTCSQQTYRPSSRRWHWAVSVASMRSGGPSAAHTDEGARGIAVDEPAITAEVRAAVPSSGQRTIRFRVQARITALAPFAAPGPRSRPTGAAARRRGRAPRRAGRRPHRGPPVPRRRSACVPHGRRHARPSRSSSSSASSGPQVPAS